MRTIQFVKATETDLDYIADVLESILPMYKDLIPGAFERLIEKFRHLRKLPVNYELWMIIQHDGDPIGFLGVESLNSEAVYLAAFYVHKDYHRMQLGSAVLAEFLSDLHTDGYKELLLFAHKDAKWAINFYLKNGFEIITDKLEEIRQYGDGILAGYFLPKPILMRKKL